MLIVDSAESIKQKRKSVPYFADQNEWHVTILQGTVNIFNFGLKFIFGEVVYVCVYVCVGGGEVAGKW